MTKNNGVVPLSAIDFLSLVKQRKVARVDLADVGYSGIIYVRDLTSAEQARMTSGTKSKARFYNDKSYEMDLAALTEASGPKFLMASVVTDDQGGALLEQAFAAADPEAEYFMVSSEILVPMSEVWIKEAGTRSKAEETLTNMPNAITNLVVKRVRELSGMAEDRVEEKKDS